MHPKSTRTGGTWGRAGCRSRLRSPAVMAAGGTVIAGAVALGAAAWPFELVADTGAAAFVLGLFLYRSGGRS